MSTYIEVALTGMMMNGGFLQQHRRRRVERRSGSGSGRRLRVRVHVMRVCRVRVRRVVLRHCGGRRCGNVLRPGARSLVPGRRRQNLHVFILLKSKYKLFTTDLTCHQHLPKVLSTKLGC